jgi:Prokaryotic Cytochrome C oxidase subunit IV
VNAGFEKRPIVVWLALSAITILQLGVGSIDRQAALARDSAIAAGAVLIALIKVRIIIREFMEVRHAPVLLGRLTDLWVALTGAILLGGYLAGAAFPKG